MKNRLDQSNIFTLSDFKNDGQDNDDDGEDTKCRGELWVIYNHSN
jgi:hypothetical protein